VKNVPGNRDLHLGFLTVVEDHQSGLFGGYLVLNPAGRPLEFHCTAPIKPTRAQEILYGPTLRAYLYGEQIGQTLFEHAAATPAVVLTDREPVLALGRHVRVPVALLLPDEASATDPPASRPLAASDGRSLRIDPPSPGGPPWNTFHWGQNRLAVPGKDGEASAKAVAERLRTLGDALDLAEPFERIRAAIEEARGGGR